jgi:hypothetical protein
MLTAFDEEAGDAAVLFGSTPKIRWWNEGQARLENYKEDSTDLTWDAGDLTVDLPSDFISVDLLQYGVSVAPEEWEVFGKTLRHRMAEGAGSDGSATLYYYREWTPLGATSELTARDDYACLYFALHRMFRVLASDRVHFRRYATMLGANAISVADLQAESDRLLNDYIDARSDDPVLPPAAFHRVHRGW